jgi:hypothetical protein
MRFCARFGLQIAKNAVFCSKVLNKIYSQDIFRGIHEFWYHYLSHCRVIPLQSFRSHKRPQPHRLGLIHASCLCFNFGGAHIYFLFNFKGFLNLWQNALECSQITLNPLVRMCNSCSKTSWELQSNFLKLPGNLFTLPRSFRKAACSPPAVLEQLLAFRSHVALESN